jgi:hypothetical protein
LATMKPQSFAETQNFSAQLALIDHIILEVGTPSGRVWCQR